jgi:hypothetical protein
MSTKRGVCLLIDSLPPEETWNALSLHGSIRHLRGRASVVAYRTHGGEPFHYAVRSYDERGRVEAMMRFTENLGFDVVYYRYNSMNKVVSVHTVDAAGQHAAFYSYDHNGRMNALWTRHS